MKRLFRFGFGLTYPSFAYRDATVLPDPRGGLNVGVTVTNTGSRAGAVLPQVYLGASPDVREPGRSVVAADGGCHGATAVNRYRLRL
ncbi:hypothetical protein QRX50_39090 [Amycolatopsis carbonis]|uniref:Uncharacterized protein n=1 Tax=Amycolatopsis carbonis TaxID=715471 RepID=A0A9Y2ICF0_9PSEU|nr:hypothetical protein [Amycolatopsis sp. 2-15]WIX77354.1 hypothetical protein QRX50_39090 [Amycolatopsis sp. 2-15]